LAGTYSSNITFAIACGLAGALSGLIFLGTDIMVGELSGSNLVVFGVLVLIAWILLPLYIKRVRPAFVLGIVAWVIALVGIAAAPGTPPWYAFPSPVYDFAVVVFYLVALAGIYFSYACYRELKAVLV
jgi:hypothetical protein